MVTTLEKQQAISERRERILELFAVNPNYSAIAREIGVSEGTVRRDAKFIGLFGTDKPYQGKSLVPRLQNAGWRFFPDDENHKPANILLEHHTKVTESQLHA